MPQIVVVGSFNSELVMYMSDLPIMGETVTGRRFYTGAGGRGSNQAIAASRLGAEVTFVGCAGDDSFGQMGRRLWQQEGINTDYIHMISGQSTGVAMSFVEDDGEDMVAITPGANMALIPDYVEAAGAKISGADVVLVQAGIPMESIERALQLAKASNVPTIFNVAPAQQFPSSLLALADILVMNDGAVETVTGHHDVPEKLARKLLQHDKQRIIVTMGAWGLVHVSEHDEGQQPAFEVNVRDALGGGDAFCAGLAVALGDRQMFKPALRFAAATAALCVSKDGSSQSMPSRAEVDTFLQRH
ncbi:MAG: ribokinase [Aggregatilineales bacterium]